MGLHNKGLNGIEEHLTILRLTLLKDQNKVIIKTEWLFHMLYVPSVILKQFSSSILIEPLFN